MAREFSKAETEALLDEVSGFVFALNDGMVFRWISNYRETNEDDCTLHDFTLSRSMGSGGSAVFGDVDVVVGLCKLSDHTLPHVLVQPKSVGGHIRRLFSGAKNVEAPPKWLASSEDGASLSPSAWRAIERFGAKWSFECMGHWAVVWTMDDERTRLAKVAERLARALSSDESGGE